MRSFKKTAAVTVAATGMILAGASAASASTGAEGAAVGSPGVLSGNVVQIPVTIPINLCGNSISVIGILNPAFGNTCINASN
jgi:Small secreted domain (DUF320).